MCLTTPLRELTEIEGSLVYELQSRKSLLSLLESICVETLFLVYSTDSLHLLLCEFEIEDVEVVKLVSRVAGSREYTEWFLDVPSFNDLNTVDTAYKAARYRAFTLYKAEKFFPG